MTRRIGRGEMFVLGVGAALLVATWIPAAWFDIPKWEVRVFHRINDLPGWLWPVVRVPMQLGSLTGSLVVVALVGLLTRDRRLTLATLAASQAAYWTARVIKEIVGRGRPVAYLQGVHLHESVLGFGYVSGHTAVAFALAAAIAPSFPAAVQVVAFALALLVGFARIYAGVHFPLDVLGGAGLGLLCGTVARFAFGVRGADVLPQH